MVLSISPSNFWGQLNAIVPRLKKQCAGAINLLTKAKKYDIIKGAVFQPRPKKNFQNLLTNLKKFDIISVQNPRGKKKIFKDFQKTS